MWLWQRALLLLCGLVGRIAHCKRRKPRTRQQCVSTAPSPACPPPLSFCAGESWLFSREGRSYRAAAAHFAHLLVERNWGLTPAGSGFERLALAAFEAGAPAAPQPQWQQCLAHTCSVSSVGCGRSE